MLGYINYEHNKKFEKLLPEGMINGQDTGAVRNYKYGLFSFGWCGCEIIGVYNLLSMYGSPAALSDIAREIYTYGNVLCGFFGTNVYTLAHYFKKHNIPVTTIYKKQEFLCRAQKGKYGVISFWTGKVMMSSIHTVAYRVAENGKVIVYNRYNGRTQDHIYDNMEAAFGKYPFIVANIM